VVEGGEAIAHLRDGDVGELAASLRRVVGGEIGESREAVEQMNGPPAQDLTTRDQAAERVAPLEHADLRDLSRHLLPIQMPEQLQVEPRPREAAQVLRVAVDREQSRGLEELRRHLQPQRLAQAATIAVKMQ